MTALVALCLLLAVTVKNNAHPTSEREKIDPASVPLQLSSFKVAAEDGSSQVIWFLGAAAINQQDKSKDPREDPYPHNNDSDAPAAKYSERFRSRSNCRPNHKVVTRDDYDIQAIGADHYKMSNRSFPAFISQRIRAVSPFIASGHFTPSIYGRIGSSRMVDCWMPSFGLKDKTVHCTAFRTDGSVLLCNQTVDYPDFMYFLYAEAIPNAGLVLVTRKFHCHEEDCFVVNVAVITRAPVEMDPVTKLAREGSIKIRRAEYKAECLWDLRQKGWAYSLILKANPADDSIELGYFCYNNGSLSHHTLRVA